MPTQDTLSAGLSSCAQYSLFLKVSLESMWYSMASIALYTGSSAKNSPQANGKKNNPHHEDASVFISTQISFLISVKKWLFEVEQEMLPSFPCVPQLRQP